MRCWAATDHTAAGDSVRITHRWWPRNKRINPQANYSSIWLMPGIERFRRLKGNQKQCAAVRTFPPGSSEPLFMSSKEYFMRTQLSQLFSRFARDDRGVTLVEYGIALILAIAVGTTALTNLGDEVQDQMGDAETLMADG
jgi:pilus assembly protein Flp/PilA